MAIAWTPSTVQLRALKLSLFLLCLAPFLTLVAGAFGVAGLALGANPVEALIHGNGDWALRFLLITLAVTPLRHLTGLAWLVRLRRMLGLFAFFYAVMHFLTYTVIDQRLDAQVIVEDIVERPYITIGMLALVLMSPLAVTSTNRMMRRLGRRWRAIHLLVYPISLLGVWHFWWQVKQDILEPAVYASILALLLGYRIWRRMRSRAPRDVLRAVRSS